MTSSSVRERYEAAVSSLTEKLQKDRVILAAVLFGSLAYDSVWEKSDLDVVLVGEESVKQASFTLFEDGISVHAVLLPRSEFRKIMEGALLGSFWTSILPRSRLLFTRDESLNRLWENAATLGERDRQAQLLRAGNACLPALTKAEKWLTVKRDCHYTAYYLLQEAVLLAWVEVIAARQNPGREVIQQALKLNPEFFHKVYTEILDGPKTEESLGAALALCDQYLTERIELCFAPLLDWLEAADGPRTVRELDTHFERNWSNKGLDLACDWLVEKGYLDSVGVPVRLTKDSRALVDETGYVFVGR